ncbi:MAG: YeiH family protein [Nitrospinota bacterium]|nr:YeiH family protein [Nitrospinota bacterium]
MNEPAGASIKPRISEDWLSLWIGLFIFTFSLGALAGWDTMGWGIKTKEWTALSQSMAPLSSNYQSLSPVMSLIFTYLFMLVVMAAGAWALRADLVRFACGFTFIFFIGYACWLAGHWAHIAATPDKLDKFGISWSLNLTGEAGFILALLAGLLVGNFTPGLGVMLKECVRPELYIKIAIVIMGGGLGVKASESGALATNVMFSGLCSIVVAYLIYWASVYYVARRYFGFSREWAAPLASGISICGVSAAIAVGGAIRARPIVPIMVSSLVVIFAVVELVLLPFIARDYLWQEPLVAGAWMALSVKTDGAAVASGAIAESLIRAKTLAETGVQYKEGWILMTATTVKMFIDIFIGVWAFLLAVIWSTKIDVEKGVKVSVAEIWGRFPKFVIGYVFTFFFLLILCRMAPEMRDAAKLASSEANTFRVLFFVLTFFTIGVVSNFKKLWEEGIGKLALLYFISLFGFIIWIGLAIAWIFFHGLTPPVA